MKDPTQLAAEAAAQWYDPVRATDEYERLKQDIQAAIEKAIEQEKTPWWHRNAYASERTKL